MSVNLIILMGRLTRDAEVVATQGGTLTAKYGLAVDKSYKREGEDTADFFNCVAFSKNAEFAQNYLKKGTKVVVQGSVSTGSYTNKDGQKVKTFDVIVARQDFAESKAASQQNGATAPQAMPPQMPNQAMPPQAPQMPANGVQMQQPNNYPPNMQTGQYGAYTAPQGYPQYQQAPPQMPPQYQQPVQQVQQQPVTPEFMQIPPGTEDELPFV